MKIEGKILSRACDLLGLVPSTPGVPSSVFIGIQDVGSKLRLMVSTPDVSASIDLPGSLGVKETISLDRRILFPFIRPEGEYSIEYTDGHVVMRHGSRTAKMSTVTPDWTYGKWELKKAETIAISKDMLSLIRCARLCACDDPILPELNGVCLEFDKSTYGFSSNDLVMGFGRLPRTRTNASTARTIFPLTLIDVMGKEKVETILVQDPFIGIEIDGAKIWGSAPKQAWSKFPVTKLKNLLVSSRKAPVVLKCRMEDLNDAVGSFLTYLANIPRQEWVLRVETSKTKGVTLSAKTPYADFTDHLKASFAQDDRQIDLNLSVLAPILIFLGDQKDVPVQVSASDAICHLIIGNYEFLLSQREK